MNANYENRNPIADSFWKNHRMTDDYPQDRIEALVSAVTVLLSMASMKKTKSDMRECYEYKSAKILDQMIKEHCEKITEEKEK